MVSVRRVAKFLAVSLVLLTAALKMGAALADDGFPFGMAMTMDVGRQPGSKRLPNVEIGDNGEAVLELWCKGGRAQCSVAGNTVILVAGPLAERACPAARAQADDELVAALSEATNWKRQGDFVSFIGTRTLRFRLDTN